MFICQGKEKIMNNKHLSVDDRRTIENLLNQNCNFTQISNVIKKHRTTNSREVYNHRIMKDPRFFYSSYSECINYEKCIKINGNHVIKNVKNIKKDNVLILSIHLMFVIDVKKRILQI